MTRFVALSLLFVACGETHGTSPSIDVVSMPVTGGSALDIALVIDDSPGVAHIQHALAEHFDTLLRALEAPAGGVLDLHVGVTTSDYGTTALRDALHPGPPLGQIGNGGCAGAGKDGGLLVSGAPVTGPYLVDGPATNYAGTRHDALGAMFRVGSGGCGFEQPLAASVRVLANAANAGFRRDSANLLVIFIQDEDDCTLLDPAMLGPESPTLGPIQSLRCTRFGVECDEDMVTVGPKHNCHAREDSPFVTGIGGFPGHYESRVADPSRRDPCARALVRVDGPVRGYRRRGSACSYAVPCRGHGPARFADHGMHAGPRPVAHRARARGKADVRCRLPRCIEAARYQPRRWRPAGGTLVIDGVEQPLPTCPADGACFEIVVDPAACAEPGDHLRFVVHDAPADAYIRGRCQVPVAGDDPN